MKIEKCYCVSFNVRNIEVWSSNLYSNTESALLETEDAKDEIAEQISAFSYSYTLENEILEMLDNAILQLRQNGVYKNDGLDFFILEKSIYQKYKPK